MSMNQIYLKNLEALLEKDAPLGNFINSLSAPEYEIARLPGGDPVLKITKSDGEVVHVGDSEDSLAEAKKLVPTGCRKKSFFIVMGMALGHLLFELKQQYPESIVMVIEFDGKIFKRALETFDFSTYLKNPQIEFVVARKAETLLAAFQNIFLKPGFSNFLPAMELVQNPCVVKLSQKYYEKAAESVRRATDLYWESCVGNSYRDSLLGLKSLLKNLQLLPRMISYEPYRAKFSHLKGIVVSSGPSLKNKITYLKRVQKKAVIICADSALKLLLENGIVPFGVASVERGTEIEPLFQGFDIPKSLTLFQSMQISENINTNFPGNVCALFRDVFPFPFLPPLLRCQNVGMCCSHLALIMLIAFGCREIALIGQDLAYDRHSGASHSGGIRNYDAAYKQTMPEQLVADNSEGQILTNMYWAMYRDVFTQITTQNLHVKVYNVIEKEFGAFIAGTLRVEPQDFFNAIEVLPNAEIDFNPDEGRDYLAKRLPNFYTQFEFKKNIALAGLEKLSEALAHYLACDTGEIYLQKKAEIVRETDPDTYYLFDRLYISQNRRFDALAQSLWTTEEFLAQREKYVTEAQQAIRELIEALK